MLQIIAKATQTAAAGGRERRVAVTLVPGNRRTVTASDFQALRPSLGLQSHAAPVAVEPAVT